MSRNQLDISAISQESRLTQQQNKMPPLQTPPKQKLYAKYSIIYYDSRESLLGTSSRVGSIEHNHSTAGDFFNISEERRIALQSELNFNP